METRPLIELAEYRERRGISISALAKELQVSKAAVSRWEAGKRRPAKRYVPILAELTGVSPLELMGLDA